MKARHRHCINVVQRWKSDCGYVSFSTSGQRYLKGDLQCWNNVDPTLKCWQGSVYEKVNSKEHSACIFTNKMKLVDIFQGLC